MFRIGGVNIWLPNFRKFEQHKLSFYRLYSVHISNRLWIQFLCIFHIFCIMSMNFRKVFVILFILELKLGKRLRFIVSHPLLMLMTKMATCPTGYRKSITGMKRSWTRIRNKSSHFPQVKIRRPCLRPFQHTEKRVYLLPCGTGANHKQTIRQLLLRVPLQQWKTKLVKWK